MGWVDDFSQGTVRMVGVLEVLAVIGLVLPPLAVGRLALVPFGA
jgi:ABC-type molybdate transport system permease subunit